jgi:hypothetical protein
MSDQYCEGANDQPTNVENDDLINEPSSEQLSKSTSLLCDNDSIDSIESSDKSVSLTVPLPAPIPSSVQGSDTYDANRANRAIRMRERQLRNLASQQTSNSDCVDNENTNTPLCNNVNEEKKIPNKLENSGNTVLTNSPPRQPLEQQLKQTAINNVVNSNDISHSVQTLSTNVFTTLETDQPTSSDQESDKFADLSYMDVQINLRLLSDIKEGEKLMVVDGRCITVDQRYVQMVRRYWTSDSRERTLRFINHLIIAAKKYCDEAVEKVKVCKNNQIKQDNLEKLINIQSLLRSSTTGLGRMATTYADDKRNLATINTFCSTISVFCDQDLKRAICDNK